MDDNTMVEVIISGNAVTNTSLKFGSITTYDPNEVTAEAKVSNTSYDYSGRHDHGNLINLNNNYENKTTKEYGMLINNVLEAKKSCDQYITSCMNTNNTSNNNKSMDMDMEDNDNDNDNDDGDDAERAKKA